VGEGQEVAVVFSRCCFSDEDTDGAAVGESADGVVVAVDDDDDDVVVIVDVVDDDDDVSKLGELDPRAGDVRYERWKRSTLREQVSPVPTPESTGASGHMNTASLFSGVYSW
jgi:hypothetical protein